MARREVTSKEWRKVKKGQRLLHLKDNFRVKGKLCR